MRLPAHQPGSALVRALLELSTHRPGSVEEPPRAERALRGGYSSLRFFRPSSQRDPRGRRHGSKVR